MRVQALFVWLQMSFVFFLFYVCVCVCVCVCICVYTHTNWSYRRSWNTMWVRGITLASSARAATAPSSTAVSSLTGFKFLTCSFFTYVSVSVCFSFCAPLSVTAPEEPWRGHRILWDWSYSSHVGAESVTRWSISAFQAAAFWSTKPALLVRF